MKLGAYLVDNRYGLRDCKLVVDGDGLRGPGAIKGNVDKLVADRMKKRCMSWTKQGADRIARPISLRETGKLNTRIKCRSKPQQIPARERIIPEEGQHHYKDDGASLRAGLLALYGPHSGRPRVQLLRAPAHTYIKI